MEDVSTNLVGFESSGMKPTFTFTAIPGWKCKSPIKRRNIREAMRPPGIKSRFIAFARAERCHENIVKHLIASRQQATYNISNAKSNRHQISKVWIPSISNTLWSITSQILYKSCYLGFSGKIVKISKFTLGAKQIGWFCFAIYTSDRSLQICEKGALSTWRACGSVLWIAPLILHHPTSNVRAPIKLTPLTRTPWKFVHNWLSVHSACLASTS